MAKPTTPKKVLVVDDEYGIRHLTDYELSHQGYTVLTAASGPEAVDILRTEEVDLILTDVQMPRMNGVEAALVLMKVAPSTPIIFMTGYRVDQQLLDALAFLRTTCLHKPFSIDNLLKVVKMHVRQ